MKVRFSNKMEHNPTTDGGLKVVYAPGKRVAYRLRWYLILLIVISPVLWFAGKLFSGVMLLESPARTLYPLAEVRALESGLVSRLHVRAGDQVGDGSPLVTLDNPGLTAQQQALSDSLQPVDVVVGTPHERQRQALQMLVERARIQVHQTERLVRAGSATRGELNRVQDLLNDRQASLAALDRSLEPSVEQQYSLRRGQSELVALDKRLEQLQVNATGDGVIRDVLVHEGESVGPGTLLLQMQSSEQVQIQVFLDQSQRDLARPGQSLRLRLPDRSWVKAEVIGEPKLVSRLPQDMRSEFSINQLGLVVEVATLEPLPAKWQLDNLQMKARFPGGRFSWWKW